jgi:hypothetical protein
MLQTDRDVLNLVHSVAAFTGLAVKVASAEGSAFAQQISAVSSDVLYDVMVKEAEVQGEAVPRHRNVVAYINKLAESQGKPTIPAPMQHKIATIVTVDDSISDVLTNQVGVKTASEYSQLFGMRAFGREFFMDIIQELI